MTTDEQRSTWQDHVRARQEDPSAHLDMLRESNLRMLAAEGFVRLDADTLTTIYGTCADAAALWIAELNGLEAEIAADELWAIDRACRVLGIDS